jgi:hypothetical protein
MVKKILILTLSFYLLAAFQSSFLAHFFPEKFLNLILISVILINFFEIPSENFGIISALIGGFFLDFFSERFFGFWILILLFISIFIKFIFKKHVRIPFAQRL